MALGFTTDMAHWRSCRVTVTVPISCWSDGGWWEPPSARLSACKPAQRRFTSATVNLSPNQKWKTTSCWIKKKKRKKELTWHRFDLKGSLFVWRITTLKTKRKKKLSLKTFRLTYYRKDGSFQIQKEFWIHCLKQKCLCHFSSVSFQTHMHQVRFFNSKRSGLYLLWWYTPSECKS